MKLSKEEVLKAYNTVLGYLMPTEEPIEELEEANLVVMNYLETQPVATDKEVEEAFIKMETLKEDIIIKCVKNEDLLQTLDEYDETLNLIKQRIQTPQIDKKEYIEFLNYLKELATGQTGSFNKLDKVIRSLNVKLKHLGGE